ncbi:hypothetical protein [Arthrobacter sp. efr-133-TYG-118]|uniref:hypothetical protein n=1 Tax=Arthrobacter sp. efr-133-TYG-118 TaxID=3040279 RepID=UPI00254A6442|nr:hypothetical protein [Arthrobacter sp. efr-133-TYG-118]
MRPDLIPGVNVDRVDVAAGCRMAAQLGYSDFQAQMIVEYAPMRHHRGEEGGAERTWLAQFPRDLTSWRAILAHAVAKTAESSAPEDPATRLPRQYCEEVLDEEQNDGMGCRLSADHDDGHLWNRPEELPSGHPRRNQEESDAADG